MVTQAGKKVLVLALAGYPALALLFLLLFVIAGCCCVLFIDLDLDLQETSSLGHVMNPQPRSSFFFLSFFVVVCNCRLLLCPFY